MENMMNYEDFFKKSQEVYSWFEDDLSKQVFELKLLWSVTNKNDFLFNLSNISLLDCIYNGKVLIKRNELKFLDNDTIVIYGILDAGQVLLKEMQLISNCKKLFCDKSFFKTPEFLGIKVISPNELVENYKDAHVFVSTNNATKPICKFLKENEFLHYYTYLYEKQYFDDLVKFSQNEVFLDCGVLDAETSILFSKKVNGKFKHIHLFEPDSINRNLSENNLSKENITNYTLHDVGVWHEKDTLKFANLGGASTILDSARTDVIDNLMNDCEYETVKVDSIDNIFNVYELENLPTYIKMDIEGAELNALKGVKNIIQKNKPKLAISIYHKPHDILELLVYIKKLVPEYKFYLRHYSHSFNETVLYAVTD